MLNSSTGEPVNHTDQVQQAASGDLNQKIEPVGDLAAAIKQVTSDLKKARAELLESEERCRLLAQNTTDVIWTVDLYGKYTFISPSVVSLRGFSVVEAMSQSFEESFTPGSAQILREKMGGALERMKNREKVEFGVYQLEQLRKDGSSFWVEVNFKGLFDPDGALIGFQGASRDITERIRSQNAEREQRFLAEALRNTSANLNSAKSLADFFDNLLENIEQVIPYDTGEILIADPNGLLRVKSSRGYQKFFTGASALLNGLIFSVEDSPSLRTMRDTGQPCLLSNLSAVNWVETEATQWAKTHLGAPILVKGKLVGFLILLGAVPGTFTEVHTLHLQAFADQAAAAIEKAHLIEQLNEMSIIDSLTGIANRRHFFNMAEQELARAVRYNRPLAALMMDVDNFKLVNDNYGHGAGDRVLEEIAQRCKQELRSIDLFGRYGGEEFSFILPESNINSGMVVAERLRKLIANKPFYAQNEAFKVTVSIGVAEFMPTIPSARALLDQAGQALIFAKQSGRNKVSKFG